jgi:hypothetical protein
LVWQSTHHAYPSFSTYGVCASNGYHDQHAQDPNRKPTYIAALRAEKMPRVPLRPAGNHNLPLNRRLARLAPRTEQLVEVQVAVEPQVPLLRRPRPFLGRALGPRLLRLRVEGDALEVLGAAEAAEARRVEARAGGGDEARVDGQRAGVAADGAGAAGGPGAR